MCFSISLSHLHTQFFCHSIITIIIITIHLPTSTTSPHLYVVNIINIIIFILWIIHFLLVYHPHVGLHGRPEKELKSMESLQESELSIDPKAVSILSPICLLIVGGSIYLPCEVSYHIL